MIDEPSTTQEEPNHFEHEKMAALVQLLIKKGVITRQELLEASSELALEDEDGDEEEI